MTFSIKVDEDLPTDVAEVLRASGHDAMTVVEQNLSGTPDPQLWVAVQEEKRLLFTADKGFGDIRHFPPLSHHGVIILRPSRESRRAYVNLTKALLRTVGLDDLTGTTATVNETGIRIRR